MKDWHTSTEADAAKAARADTYPDWQDERDEQTVLIVEDDHRCESVDCQRLLCVLDRVVARQKREADPVWREHVAQQNAEYWKEGA